MMEREILNVQEDLGYIPKDPGPKKLPLVKSLSFYENVQKRKKTNFDHILKLQAFAEEFIVEGPEVSLKIKGRRLTFWPASNTFQTRKGFGFDIQNQVEKILAHLQSVHI